MNAVSRDIVLNGSRIDVAALFVGPVCILALLLLLAGRNESIASALDAAIVLASALLWVALWLAAAAGFGWPLRLWLHRECEEPAALQLGLGVAAMLLIDAALGRLGTLQIGGTLGAWAVIVVGIMLLALWAFRSNRSAMRASTSVTIVAPPWIIWSAAPAVAVLLLAAASAPGWLWASEFGGYDAMSYHLQLPKQWIQLGAIQPLENNVYSFFPSYMEGAYYHLMLLRGDAIAAVYACQLLHAVLTIATAWVVCRIAARYTGNATVGAIAAVVLLGTPWVIVVGSLAYNEMAALLMLATGLLAAQECSTSNAIARRGAMMGVLAATACGAKLTAAGFVALPLGIALIVLTPWRQLPRAIAAGAVAGLLVLSPFLIGNTTAAGNPVFPFATSAFGTGHWDQQQVDAWNEAHMSGLPVSQRLWQAWHQLMRYGIGHAPIETEPWHAQWSILPWLTLAALAVLLLVRQSTSAAARQMKPMVQVLAVALLAQMIFWLSFTHIKSRFMLPAAVPAALLVALAWHTVAAHVRLPLRTSEIALGAALLLWCIVPAVIFTQQAGGRPAARVGMAELLTGAGMADHDRRNLGEVHPAVYLNHLLAEDARVLLIGEAAPLYYLGDYAYQTTWDRGALSIAMRTQVDDDFQAWRHELLAQGYTHLLIQPSMLDRWERSGWNDPLLTADRVNDFVEQEGELIHNWPTGERLYRLR